MTGVQTCALPIFQFTRSKDGLGGVLRKALGQASGEGNAGRALHPSVQHMLLIGASEGRWLATHPPIAERIRRVYGRHMSALSSDDELPTRPDVIY